MIRMLFWIILPAFMGIVGSLLKNLKGSGRFLLSAILCIGLLTGTFRATAQSVHIQDNASLWKQIRHRPPQVAPDSIRLFFIGDVMMHKAQIGRDYKLFLSDLDSTIAAADLAVANMEFPLGGRPYTGYPAFSAPDEYAKVISDLGIDVFLTANNHILDKGTAGLVRTLKEYSKIENGPMFTGTSSKDFPDSLYNPLVLNIKGIRLALVNCTYGTNFGFPPEDSGVKVHSTDKADIEILMERARKAGADFIIALPHWGEEYVLKHNRKQETSASILAEKGAGVIIGAHPHVIQDTCTIITDDGRRVPVIYSLGNAVSNMSAKNTRLELAVTVILERSFPWQVRLAGVELEYLWCTLPGTLTDGYKTIRVRKYLDRRDLWKRAADFDNMVNTLERVQKETGTGK